MVNITVSAKMKWELHELCSIFKVNVVKKLLIYVIYLKKNVILFGEKTEKNPYIMRPLPDVSNPIVFGARPPDKESYEDICGPPQTCPDCPDPRFVQLFVQSKSLYSTH